MLYYIDRMCTGDILLIFFYLIIIYSSRNFIITLIFNLFLPNYVGDFITYQLFYQSFLYFR